jgi:hypothetical protein
MLARGYRGHTPALDPLAFGRADALFVGGALAGLVALRAGLGVAA